ncbi:MAG TPA: PadR family transcriptional regulator [Micromonosporaceae bacterium]|nr:PadR family transcriptional regulator [Micromonosporaceae bacterium]
MINHWLHESRRFAFGPWRPPFGGHGPGFGPGFGPGPGRRRGRGGRRGNVRAAVLALLTERPMHGYEMISELDARTGGIWRPSPGSIYPTLQLLEDEGLIASETSEGRKRFTLTEAGHAEAAHAAENAPWQEFADDTVSQAQDFREAAFGIMHALRQVGFAGTDEQRARALEVLTETKRKLYAILADSE